jgi:hypothetical protein
MQGTLVSLLGTHKNFNMKADNKYITPTVLLYERF